MEAIRSLPLSRGGTSLSELARWAGDALAVAILGGAFWYLAAFDGGSEIGTVGLTRLGIVALLASPVAVVEAGRLPKLGRVLLGAWGIGLLLALLFASDRSHSIHPTLTYGLIPFIPLMMRRLWRRDLGPLVLVGILAISFFVYFRDALLAWWGWQMAERAYPRWLALSWHNQSGMLMGAYGVIFFGPAILARRRPAIPLGLAAGAALAATWLSGSRGAIAATVCGLAVVAVGARRAGWPSVIMRGGLVLLGGAVLAGALLQLGPGDQPQPVVARPEPAAETFGFRLEHIEAGFRMFAARPLTGHGPGSYRRTAPAFTSPEAYLTSSAHSEPVEALAEGGLAFGLPLLGMLASAGLLVLWTLRKPQQAWMGDLKRPLRLGMLAASAALGLHLMLDFDWTYPVLAFLLVGGAFGIPNETTGQPRGPGLLFVPTAAVLALAVLAALSPVAPWEPVPRLRAALDLSAGGAHQEAAAEIEGALGWNPGDPALRTGAIIIRYRSGRASGSELRSSIEPGRTSFGLANLVAGVLLEGGDHEAAGDLLGEMLAAYPTFDESRRPPETVAETWFLRIRHAGETGGCGPAREAAARASTDPELGLPVARAAFERFASRFCPAGSSDSAHLLSHDLSQTGGESIL